MNSSQLKTYQIRLYDTYGLLDEEVFKDTSDENAGIRFQLYVDSCCDLRQIHNDYIFQLWVDKTVIRHVKPN